MKALLEMFGISPRAILIATAAGLALFGLWLTRDMLHDYRDGQRAIGAQDAQQKDTADVDAANRARVCVQSCRLDGGVWDRAAGACIVAGVSRPCR